MLTFDREYDEICVDFPSSTGAGTISSFDREHLRYTCALIVNTDGTHVL